MRRRTFLRLLALPAGAWLAGLHSLTAAYQGKVKITAIKAMQVCNIAGNCLVKIETDQGLVVYGELGVSRPMMRARLAQFEPLLVGKDPLTIEKHFLDLTTLMHPYMAHIPSISGIDIALWERGDRRHQRRHRQGRGTTAEHGRRQRRRFPAQGRRRPPDGGVRARARRALRRGHAQA